MHKFLRIDNKTIMYSIASLICFILGLSFKPYSPSFRFDNHGFTPYFLPIAVAFVCLNSSQYNSAFHILYQLFDTLTLYFPLTRPFTDVANISSLLIHVHLQNPLI